MAPSYLVKQQIQRKFKQQIQRKFKQQIQRKNAVPNDNASCALQNSLSISETREDHVVVTKPGFKWMKATKEEEELSAEERRKLERKLKKERKKKEKQLMREAGMAVKKVVPKKQSAPELALAYLTREILIPEGTSGSLSWAVRKQQRWRFVAKELSWSEKPKEWKFQKTRQTWLLLHMYEKEKVPDEYFTILLDYLQGLQGSARDLTVQKAEAFMKELDGSDAQDPKLLAKCERIRQVLQLLS
ncbi:hypothetical protein Q9966_002455 [Columba livia]|nr:hypothetical protein Q9966_002455 [Columba livia]